MKIFDIQLTEAELNLIGAALGRMPYQDVFQLISNLQQQVQPKEQSNGDTH